MRRQLLVLSVLATPLAILWLAGCGGGSSSSGNGPIPGADGRTVPARAPAPAMNVTVSTDKSTYKTGDAIQITVSAQNTDTKSHTLAYPTGNPIVHWGYIIAQNGKIVTYEYWSGHNLAFTDGLGSDVYQPGETKQFNYVFPYSPVGATPPPVTSLPPGSYQVYARQADLTYDGSTAIRNATPTPASNPITITVTQ